MLGVGLIWALTRGWQLTLAGFAVAPVFAGVMALQTKLVVRCEVRNRKAREDVARGYYNVRSFSFSFFFGLLTYNLFLKAIINFCGIRCMAFEGLFKAQFDSSVNKALTTGIRGAFVQGCTYGVASGLITTTTVCLLFLYLY